MILRLAAVMLQEGIYYRRKSTPRSAFCIISLRGKNTSEASDVGKLTAEIYAMLTKLKKGITGDVQTDVRHRKAGNLTALVAYGATVFELSGCKKKKPEAFADMWNFKAPKSSGGGQILDCSSVSYSPVVTQNNLLMDHVLFQFIADDEFYTNRAVVEVWKELNRHNEVNSRVPFHISGIFPGFQREDQRSWLGFHDGVSNLKTKDREFVVPINSRYLNSRDSWTISGTYLAFMRTVFNLEKWENIPRNIQEIIIGRDKLTGCPLIRIDKNNKPVTDSRCPVPGTSEIIDSGNEHFRDHIPYMSPQNSTLRASHIGSTRPVDKIPIWDKKSPRIYRQGSEFLEKTRDHPGFVVGLNFVSFQNTPERLHRLLAYQNMIADRSKSIESIPRLEEFFSVISAGIFFVPPIVEHEPFPGAQVFFNRNEFNSISIKK